MEYYTNKNKLILTEYGRNIQQMVEYAMTIEDKAERTRCVHTIINIMGNLFPHLRDVNDFKHKLWDHLAMMSNYQLDIDYPYEITKPESVESKPDKMPYPDGNIKYRHYGKTIPNFIEAATQLADQEKEEILLPLLANQMKKYFITWNKENVEDDKIFEDIQELSHGRFNLNESNLKLKDAKELMNPTKKGKNWNYKNKK